MAICKTRQGHINKNKTVRSELRRAFFGQKFSSVNPWELTEWINLEAGEQVVTLNEVRLRLINLERDGLIEKIPNLASYRPVQDATAFL